MLQMQFIAFAFFKSHSVVPQTGQPADIPGLSRYPQIPQKLLEKCQGRVGIILFDKFFSEVQRFMDDSAHRRGGLVRRSYLVACIPFSNRARARRPRAFLRLVEDIDDIFSVVGILRGDLLQQRNGLRMKIAGLFLFQKRADPRQKRPALYTIQIAVTVKGKLDRDNLHRRPTVRLRRRRLLPRDVPRYRCLQNDLSAGIFNAKRPFFSGAALIFRSHLIHVPGLVFLKVFQKMLPKILESQLLVIHPPEIFRRDRPVIIARLPLRQGKPFNKPRYIPRPELTVKPFPGQGIPEKLMKALLGEDSMQIRIAYRNKPDLNLRDLAGGGRSEAHDALLKDFAYLKRDDPLPGIRDRAGRVFDAEFLLDFLNIFTQADSGVNIRYNLYLQRITSQD